MMWLLWSVPVIIAVIVFVQAWRNDIDHSPPFVETHDFGIDYWDDCR